MGGVRVLLAAALLVSAAAACDRGDDDDDAASPTPLDVTFRGGVLPVLAAVAHPSAACHDDVDPAAELPLGGPSLVPEDVYIALHQGGDAELAGGPQVIDTANAAQSSLLREPLEGSDLAHTGGKQFASTDEDGYLTILGWIAGGAPND